MRKAFLTMVVCLAAGCATPRVITSITTSQDEMKLVYARANSTETGIIRCDVAGDGSLENCEKLPVTFLDKKEAR